MVKSFKEQEMEKMYSRVQKMCKELTYEELKKAYMELRDGAWSDMSDVEFDVSRKELNLLIEEVSVRERGINKKNTEKEDESRIGDILGDINVG